MKIETPAEAIAALEAAYPDYRFCICRGIQVVFQRTGIKREVTEDAPTTRWTVTAFKNGRVADSVHGELLPLAVASFFRAYPTKHTQRAIEQVAAGLADEALLKRP